MQDYDDRNKAGRTTGPGVLLPLAPLAPLAIAACIALLASDCSKSHVQETVTVAPRATAPSAPAITVSSGSVPPELGDETEAAGDALAHAIVALKTRHRDEALRYMSLARIRLTRLINRTDVNTNSKATRERLITDLRELDAAERAARHNDYEQSGAQLVSITNELDHLTDGLSPRQN